MRLTFESEQGYPPVYITMNWQDYFKCRMEVGYGELTHVFKMSIFINPCLKAGMIHLSFERLN